MLSTQPLTGRSCLHGLTLTKSAARPQRLRLSAAARTPVRCTSSTSLGDVQAVSARGALPSLPGVYACYNSENELQYVGISRKINASIQMHLNEPEAAEALETVKVQTLQGASREDLQAAWKSWIQSYIDENGKIPPGNSQGNQVWVGKRPARPQGLKPPIKLTPGGNKELTLPMEELLDNLVKSTDGVLLFMKGSPAQPECGFSARVVSILQTIGCQFESVNVLDQEYNPGLREIIKSYSAWPTIPQMYYKGEFIGGADIVEEMFTSGELQKLIKPTSS